MVDNKLAFYRAQYEPSLRAWVLPMLIIQVHQSFPNASLQEPRWCYLSAFDSLQVSHHRQSHVIQSVYPSMRGAQLITVVVMDGAERAVLQGGGLCAGAGRGRSLCDGMVGDPLTDLICLLSRSLSN